MVEGGDIEGGGRKRGRSASVLASGDGTNMNTPGYSSRSCAEIDQSSLSNDLSADLAIAGAILPKGSRRTLAVISFSMLIPLCLWSINLMLEIFERSASSSKDEAERYALVSSLYGPGTIGAWYLTTFACFISIVHRHQRHIDLYISLYRRERWTDSFTADFIVVLALPVVVAAHLICQVRSYPRDLQFSDYNDMQSAQRVASIEAALTITEGSSTLLVSMSIVLQTVFWKRVRGVYLLAIVGLFCYAVECYLYFSASARKAVFESTDREVFCYRLDHIFLSTSYLFTFFVLHLSKGIGDFYFRRALEIVNQKVPFTIEEEEAKKLDWAVEGPLWSFVDMYDNIECFMCFTCAMHVATMCHLNSSSINEGWFVRPPQVWIPRSNNSISELDQAVAFFAGAVMLASSLYNVAVRYYKSWPLSTRGVELNRGLLRYYHSR